MVVPDPTIGQAFVTLLKKSRRLSPSGDPCSYERVEAVFGDGTAQVRGVRVPISGTSTVQTGERVVVAWRDSAPLVIIKHSIKRFKGDTPVGRGGAILEELFIAPDPDTGDQIDVWFRNFDVVFPLNVRATMGQREPMEVKWGAGKDRFVVRDFQSKWWVFRFDRDSATIFPVGNRPTAIFETSYQPFSQPDVLFNLQILVNGSGFSIWQSAITHFDEGTGLFQFSAQGIGNQPHSISVNYAKQIQLAGSLLDDYALDRNGHLIFAIRLSLSFNEIDDHTKIIGSKQTYLNTADSSGQVQQDQGGGQCFFSTKSTRPDPNLIRFGMSDQQLMIYDVTAKQVLYSTAGTSGTISMTLAMEGYWGQIQPTNPATPVSDNFGLPIIGYRGVKLWDWITNPPPPPGGTVTSPNSLNHQYGGSIQSWDVNAVGPPPTNVSACRTGGPGYVLAEQPPLILFVENQSPPIPVGPVSVVCGTVGITAMQANVTKVANAPWVSPESDWYFTSSAGIEAGNISRLPIAGQFAFPAILYRAPLTLQRTVVRRNLSFDFQGSIITTDPLRLFIVSTETFERTEHEVFNGVPNTFTVVVMFMPTTGQQVILEARQQALGFITFIDGNRTHALWRRDVNASDVRFYLSNIETGITVQVASDEVEFLSHQFHLIRPELVYALREEDRFFVDHPAGLVQGSQDYPIEDATLSELKALTDLPAPTPTITDTDLQAILDASATAITDKDET